MNATSSQTKSMRLFQAVEESKWKLPLPDQARRMILSGAFGRKKIHGLQRWLDSDPQLCDRLIQWSNSPLFNLSERFSTMAQVTAVLGQRWTTQLAVLVSMRNLFLPNVRIDCYSREQLWRHSIAVGSVAALVSRVCNVTDPQTAFVGGALHDVGLLASEKVNSEAFALLISELDVLTDTAVTERHRSGWDHQQLGAELLDSWGFDKAFSDVARYHHQSHRANEAKDEQLVHCVIVADYLCSRCGWTELGLHNVAQPSDSVFAQLGIDQACLAILWQQLYATLEQTRVFN